MEVHGTIVPRYGGAREIVGLDPRDERVVCISNSERASAFCLLRWRFAYPERLRPKSTARPLRFGDWFHRALEEIYRWWKAFDAEWPADGLERCPWCSGQDPACVHCRGTGMGPTTRIMREAEVAAFHSQDPRDEDPRQTAEAVRRAVEGYLIFWGRTPPRTYRIVDVEVNIAKPILGLDGKPYCPEIPVADAGYGRIRMASASQNARTVKWPWWMVGKLDAVGQDRQTGALWVIEHKSSTAPETFFRGLSVDPQTTAYLSLLEHAAKTGRYGVRTPEVAGYLYDVASSSFHHDPLKLKDKVTKARGTEDRGFSVAKERTVPSWRFRAALQLAGADQAPYEEHIAYLVDHVDPKLYRREFGDLGYAELHRAEMEVYAVARKLAQGRRDVIRACTPDEVAALFPRSPVCRQAGGSCPYRDICVNDSLEARQRYEQGADQEWLTVPPAQQQLLADGNPAESQVPIYEGFDSDLGF